MIAGLRVDLLMNGQVSTSSSPGLGIDTKLTLAALGPLIPDDQPASAEVRK